MKLICVRFVKIADSPKYSSVHFDPATPHSGTYQELIHIKNNALASLFCQGQSRNKLPSPVSDKQMKLHIAASILTHLSLHILEICSPFTRAFMGPFLLFLLEKLTRISS